MAVPRRFHEILFDYNLYRTRGTGEAPLEGWPVFANTQGMNEKTGAHKTNVNRTVGLENLSLSIILIDDDDKEYLLDFWCGGFGSGIGFRMRVPYAYKVTQERFGTGDGVKTIFQLYRKFIRPGATDFESAKPILKPVVQLAKEKNSFQLYMPNGTTARTPDTPLAIQFDGVNQPSGWTVDAKTGKVYFTSPPADDVAISWTGEYDIPAAFLGNSLPFRHDVSSEAQSIRFREIPYYELGITLA